MRSRTRWCSTPPRARTSSCSATPRTASRARTLLARIDETRTPLGARRLARWLAYPLVDPAAILARQAAVAFLAERDRLRARLRDVLRRVRDLERLLAKAARPGATPPDLAALRASLEALPGVEEALAQRGDEARGREPFPAELPVPRAVPRVAELLREALEDEVRALPRGSRGALETGYIRAGFHTELDGVREGVHKGREWIAGLESEERERTGIATLKIRFHPVFGYWIEVTKAQPRARPARLRARARRSRTRSGSRRRDCARSSARCSAAPRRAAALEREIFERLRLARARVGGRDLGRRGGGGRPRRARLARGGGAARRLDAPATSTRECGSRSARAATRWSSGSSRCGAEAFVPNDVELDPRSAQSLVLTGPNMAGKSTYLRQVALIVLLAQMGSYRARRARADRAWWIGSSPASGASDDSARGESTFMVEMRETAEILRARDAAQPGHPRRDRARHEHVRRALDRLGGGGVPARHAGGCGSRTLFATHYHELADLLAHEAARGATPRRRARVERRGRVPAPLVEGGASRSYGIQVARLAGLPDAVIRRARGILANLEGGELDARGRPRLAADAGEVGAPAQLGLFGAKPRDPREESVLADLRELKVDETTPLDALAALARWQKALREEEES